MQQKLDVKLGTWNVRSLYRTHSLKTVGSKLGNHKLDLVTVQEVRWDNGGSQAADDIHFSMEMGQAFSYIRTSDQQWNESIINTLYQNGDIVDSSNYRVT
jgi:exonuclease III